MRLARAALATGVTLLCAAALAAQSGTPHQTQFWPEIDYFQSLSLHTRLFASAQWSLQGLPGQEDEQYGIALDIMGRPRFIGAHLLGADALEDDRREWAQLRVGYKYNQSINTDSAKITNRLFAEVTNRGRIGVLYFSDRNGFDWRWVDGAYSTRYRNRVEFQLASTVSRYRLAPYSNCEWAYVLGRAGWSSIKCEFGAQFPVLRHLTVIPYYGLLNLWQGNPVNTQAFGLTLTSSF